MMAEYDVLAVLDRLFEERVQVWVDGGWGIDALVGHATREHEDLDLVIAQSDCPAAEAALAALGYAHDVGAHPRLPARLVLADCEGRRVDLHPVVFDARGDGWQPLGDGTWGGYAADGLAGIGLIGERRVRCLTPQLQLRHHLGYPPDDGDRHDLRTLADHFGAGTGRT